MYHLYQNIKNRRLELGLSQQELADRVGYKDRTSIAKIESGEVDLSQSKILLFATALDAKPIDLFGWDKDCSITEKEQQLIEKYRVLDTYGKQAVHAVVEVEYTRCLSSVDCVRESVRPIRYYQRVASAGSGQVLFDGIPVDQIEIPDTEEYSRVAYAVGVNGDSMEPDYQDGDILLVEPTIDLRIGEVGIFNVDGSSYVKELGTGELVSYNPSYKPIRLNDQSRCLGRVIGKMQKGECYE